MAKKKVKKKIVKKPLKKKVVRKKVIHKKVVRKKVPRKTTKIIPKTRSKLALRNLIFFAVLALISLILYRVSENEMYDYLFGLLSIIFACIGAAFLILFLAIVFSREKVRKRK